MWHQIDDVRLSSVGLGAKPELLLAPLLREKLGVAVRDWRILGKTVDARRGAPVLIYTLAAETVEMPRTGLKLKAIAPEEMAALENPGPGLPEDPAKIDSPLVVGTGPCGIFAALGLALAGCEPVIIDRGFDVERRDRDYAEFLRSRKLDPESNLLIGEGGAGTYSDGKLYTGTRNERAAFILKTFVEAGAPPEIRYLKRPHIGSDYLGRVAKSLRRKLESLGAKFIFGTEVTDVLIENGRCVGVKTRSGETMRSEAVVLAPGLGARELNAALRKRVAFSLKGFQLGCRIEHPQRMVDRMQYHLANRPAALEAAEYHLLSRPARGKSVSSFCMCPGGQVVMASAWENRLVSNGMSCHARALEYANSALIVTLEPGEFANPEEAFGLLAKLESEAFRMGGGDYAFPAQDAAGFLRGEKVLRNAAGSAATGMRAARLDMLVPGEVRSALKEAIRHFDRNFNEFAVSGKLLGIESCVSSPVRFERTEGTLASSAPGLWIGGEFGGWAGGIMSAAGDGLKIATAMLQKK